MACSQLTVPNSDCFFEPHHTFVKFLLINSTVKSRWFCMPITALFTTVEQQWSVVGSHCSGFRSDICGYWLTNSPLKTFYFAMILFCMKQHPLVGAFRIRKASHQREYLKEKRDACTIARGGVDGCRCTQPTPYPCCRSQEFTDAQDDDGMNNQLLQLALQVTFIGCVSTRTVGGEQLKFHCCSVHHQRCYVQHGEQPPWEGKGSRRGAVSSHVHSWQLGCVLCGKRHHGKMSN